MTFLFSPITPPLPLSSNYHEKVSWRDAKFKAVVRDDRILDRRFGRLAGCGFTFEFVGIGSWFPRGVHTHQKVRIKIIPPSVAITERVATPGAENRKMEMDLMNHVRRLVEWTWAESSRLGHASGCLWRFKNFAEPLIKHVRDDS